MVPSAGPRPRAANCQPLQGTFDRIEGFQASFMEGYSNNKLSSLEGNDTHIGRCVTSQKLESYDYYRP